MRSLIDEKGALAWAGCRKGNSTFFITREDSVDENHSTAVNKKPVGASAERHAFLQYAMLHFRDTNIKEDSRVHYSGSLRGTIRILEYLTGKQKKRDNFIDWTWKELTDKVKYSPFPIETSLLKLNSEYLNRLAVDSFTAIMRFMGDLPLGLYQKEVECVYIILVICHHHPVMRDELYCQLIKQTTNNKSLQQDSSIRGWRLLAFMTAFFKCSDSLMPYLSKYLTTAADDSRRMERETAQLSIENLSKTIDSGGRRNVPSEQEVQSVIEGRFDRQQVYFLPGGLQIALTTSVSTLVDDIIKAICKRMQITEEPEFQEFSLYCIVEGDQYTLPLEKDEYILDLIAELERNEDRYYLVFCRSVWNYDLRLNSELYIDITFHQIVPDYLEGYLLVLAPQRSKLSQELSADLLRIAALLHRANGNTKTPDRLELMASLPKTFHFIHEENSERHMDFIKKLWHDMAPLYETEAKAQCLELLQRWPLFGSCFFGIKMIEGREEIDHLLAVNKSGVNVLDIYTHETLWRFSFSSIHAPRNDYDLLGETHKDIVFGDATVKKTLRLQVDHAHEVTRLIHQYETIQKLRNEKENAEIPTVMIKF